MAIYDRLRGTADPGVYLIQSQRDPTCYRIGAAGTQSSREGSLFKRLTQHHRHNTPARSDVNWTEYYRKWDILWAYPMQGAGKVAVRLAESLVFGHFAASYVFLPESEGSGLCAPASAAVELAALAVTLEPLIDAIVAIQTQMPDRPLWKKGDRLTPSSFVAR